MCDECHQSPHATMCPNGTPMVDTIYVDCALCGAEVDEETTTYGICEKCWTEHHNFDNALAYGASEQGQQSIKINGMYTKMLSAEVINLALLLVAREARTMFMADTDKWANEFLSDDDGDFADWLVEQKKGGG